MTRPQRLCIEPGCSALHRNPGPRCGPHEQAHQRTKNQKAGYRRTRQWQEMSLAARAAEPWCHCDEKLCHDFLGGPCMNADLVTDHVTNRSLEGGVRVLCRECNSRKGNR